MIFSTTPGDKTELKFECGPLFPHRCKKCAKLCNPTQTPTASLRYYENRTGERFSALESRLNAIEMEIDTVASSINATVNHVQSMYKYINVESSSCQSRLGKHTEDLQVGKKAINISNSQILNRLGKPH